MESCKIYNIIKTSHTHNICYYILHVNVLCICITFTVSVTQTFFWKRWKLVADKNKMLQVQIQKLQSVCWVNKSRMKMVLLDSIQGYQLWRVNLKMSVTFLINNTSESNHMHVLRKTLIPCKALNTGSLHVKMRTE